METEKGIWISISNELLSSSKVPHPELKPMAAGKQAPSATNIFSMTQWPNPIKGDLGDTS